MKERIAELIAHLKAERVVLSQNEFAEKMGVKPSQLSEMINGKRAISERTVNIIASAFAGINPAWILTGDGAMVKADDVRENAPPADNVSIPASVWEVIRNQAESLKAKDDQTAEVIAILREQLKKGQGAEDQLLAAN